MESDDETLAVKAGGAKGKAAAAKGSKDAKTAAKGKAAQSKKRARDESEDEEEDDDDDEEASVDSSDGDSEDDSDDDGSEESDDDDDEDDGVEGVMVDEDDKPAKAAGGSAKGKKAAPAPKKPAAKGKAAPAAKAAPAKGKAAAAPAPAKKKAASAPAPAKKAKKVAQEEEEDEEDEEEDEQDSDGDEGMGGAAAGAGAGAKAKGKGKAAAASSSAAAPKARPAKALKPSDKLEAAMKAYKWWEAPRLEHGVKWKSMEHAGVIFPPEYKPHGVKLLYEGKPVELNKAQEEMATMYAAVSPDAIQLATEKTARQFNRNFWKEFERVLGKEHAVQEFSKCDFSLIRAYLKTQSDARKAASKEEKEAAKDLKQGQALRHGFALVDGHIEKMGNYMVEPPGLFRGRGLHPKMGSLKRRIVPEDITINVAHTATVPPCPIPGHSWKRVVHDPTVTWLAYWRDPVGDHHKYVFLAASSSFKGRADMAKYEKARRLVHEIGRIRAHYEKLLSSEDEFERQSGTVMWIIDKLALRVGGEKDEDEADTVGCCSLRAEHLKIVDEGVFELDFLGKDSMRYNQVIKLYEKYGDSGVTRRVFKNLRHFLKGKKVGNDKAAGDDIFDMLNPTRLNEQLNELMPGLSAKVFRTYNASITLEKELENLPTDTPNAEKFLEYQRANREVAILCNHQRTVPKAHWVAYKKLEEKKGLYERQLEELRGLRDELRGGAKAKGKGGSAFIAAKSKEAIEKEAEAAAKAGQAAYDKAKEEGEGGAGAGAGAGAAGGSAGGSGGKLDKDREKELKDGATAKFHEKRIKEEDGHRFARMPSLDQVEARIVQLEDKLDHHLMVMRDKDDNKEVALGTSKINYMDPRITVAWCKRVELPIERVFAKTLQDKFPWAMGAPSTFRF